MIQSCVRLSIVVVLCLFSACQARLEVAESTESEDARTQLPEACFNGTTSLRIRVDGRPLRVTTPPGVVWSDRQAGGQATLRYSPSPGIELHFVRVDEGPAAGGSGPRVRLTVGTRVADASEVAVELVLAPSDLGSDLAWSRRSSALDPAVVTLARAQRPGRRVDSIWGRDSGRLWHWKTFDGVATWTPLVGLESVSDAVSEVVSERAGVAFRCIVPAYDTREVIEWSFSTRPAVITSSRPNVPRSLGGWAASANVVAVAARLNEQDVDGSETPGVEDRAVPVQPLLEMASFPSLSTIELSAGSEEEKIQAVSALSRRGFQIALRLTPFGIPARGADEPASEAIIRDERNRPVAGGVLGELVWDPTTPKGREEIARHVSHELARFGAREAPQSRPRVLRVSYLAEALTFYERHARLLGAAKSSDAVPTGLGATALREAIQSVRAAVGDDCVLAGDWNTPAEAAGLVEFARPRLFRSDGGDLLRRDALCTLREYGYHDVIWSCEGLNFEALEDQPGGLGLRSSFRALVDLRALTGRSFFFQQAPTGLVQKRWAMIRHALPPLACRFLDLPSEGQNLSRLTATTASRIPPIWLLDPGVHGPETHDVVGIFNFDAFSPQRITVALDRLGWSGTAERPVLVFDRHRQEFLGAVSERFDLFLPPRASRLLSLHVWPEGRPVFVSDARYLVDGQRSVHGLDWSSDRRELAFRVQAPEPALRPDGEREHATLHLAMPVEAPLRVASVDDRNGKVELERSGAHQIVHVGFEDNADDTETEEPVDIRMRFVESRQPTGARSSPVVRAPSVSASFDPSTGGAWLQWPPVRSGLASRMEGYEVFRNGELIDTTFDRRFLDLPKPRVSGDADRYAVAIRWRDSAHESVAGPDTSFRWPDEESVALSMLAPRSVEQAWGAPGLNRGADGRALRLGGLRIDSGIGVAVPSRLEYDLRGRFRRLRLRVGIDTGAGLATRARFRIELDGKTVFESELMGYGDDPARVDVAVVGGRQLALVALSLAADREQMTGLSTAVWADGVLVPQ